MRVGAILLAGGRGARVDGAAKPLFEVGGRTLLQRAVDAVREAGADPIVVVGPVLDDALPVRWVREDPPFGGPAAAVIAALHASALHTSAGTPDPEWTLLLACDLARPDAAVRRLLDDLPLFPTDTDGVCLADAGSRPQWLTGAYRTAALRRAAASLPGAGRDAPMRALLDDLAIAVVRVPDGVVADVDTWEDLERARRADTAPTPTPEEDT
ncbi:MAG: NTP transferase domain-containing protein [Microbacterium sp.]|uniref:molybdenum cofactor guanylyltransferase n=1 Tax=Microbacterium sp. TaxID=51671 RepID=UPI002629F36F|nr:NTP transferase domain-containing protein [Microbacterium sp.]MCX6502786.1 NTP transferase domain-containing protein [Microbacterium sp.]